MTLIEDMHDAVERVLEAAFPESGTDVSPMVGDLHGNTFAIVWQLAENAPATFSERGRSFALSVTVQVKLADLQGGTAALSNFDLFTQYRDRLAAAFAPPAALTKVNVTAPVGSVITDLGESIPEQAAQLGLAAVTRTWTIVA